LRRFINLVDAVGKNKLARWAELETFGNVIQPETSEISGKNHSIKGKWRESVFFNNNPVVLELACGKGEYTTGLAGIFPERNFIGVDIKGSRMWRGAKTAGEKELRNTAFLRTRIEFINSFFMEDEIDEIWIIFPDPHTGKRNSNKRLTSPWFLNKYRLILKDCGLIHLKTDNSELYRYTEKLVQYNRLEIIKSTDDLYGGAHSSGLPFFGFLPYITDIELTDKISDKIISLRTHYENIFLKEGLKINYLSFKIDKKIIVNEAWQKVRAE
jgi:tRNA (guanine-N7-)-methyltransferase